MTQLFLIRHAQNEWTRNGKLAGWTPGVHLDAEGQRQAERLGKRLAHAGLQAIYSSPLERAVETAQAVLKHYPDLELQLDRGIGEAEYGKWTGKRLRQLARSRLWQIVQNYPSGARFPEGEGIHEMQFRAVSTLERIAAKYPRGRIAIISHADVIKAIVAHYAGVHLDLFQRFVISPASISIINLSQTGPAIIRLNDISHYENWHQPDNQG